MLTYRCTCCGSTIQVEEDRRIGKCPVCDNLFVLPNQFANKQNIYHLAAEALANRNFDLALTYYSRILKVDATETAAHWGFLLSKYGVEISQRAITYQNVIFHRLERGKFTDDPSYEKLITYCPPEALYYYQGLSRRIEERQRRLLDLSAQIPRYDLYINCVAGPGTEDYILANQVGKTLDDAGYRVFLPCTMLSSIPLEDRNLYEIAAAEKAAAMIVIVTGRTEADEPRYEAVWKRFLAYRRQDAGRKMLSVFRGIDPRQLPLELQPLQSIPVDGPAALDEVLSQINKMFGRQDLSASATREILDLLRQGKERLEEGDFARAAALFQRVRDLNVEEGEAHWGLVCAATENLTKPVFSEQVDTDYQRALQFSDPAAGERYQAAMQALMGEPAWKDLMALTGDLTKAEAEGRADVEQAIGWVSLYLPKSDPRLGRISRFRRDARMYREARELKAAYDRRDAAVQPLFADQTKAENDYLGNQFRRENQLTVTRKLSTGLFAILTVLIVSQFLLVHSYTYSLTYTGILYVLSTLLFAGCVVAAAVWLARTLRMPFGLILGIALCGVAWYFHGPKTQLIHFVALVVALLLWLASCVAAVIIAALAKQEKADQNHARQRVKEVNEQIRDAYGKDMRALYARYEQPQHPIPEYQVRNSSDFSMSDRPVRVLGPVAFLVRSVVMAAVVVGVVTVVNNWLYASGWEDITGVTAGAYHVIGIKEDGTVVANGRNDHGQCDVAHWTDIVQVETGFVFTAGLRGDGTVCVAGDEDLRKAVSGWRDVVKISASDDHVVGLKSDGTLVAAGGNANGECEVSTFTDVKLFTANTKDVGNFTFAIGGDGTVYCTAAEGWDGIIGYLSELVGPGEGQMKPTGLYGDYGALILTSDDGAFQGVGANNNEQLSRAEEWDTGTMTELYVGNFTLGLKRDGTVEFAGTSGSVLAQVTSWKNVRDLDGSDVHVLGLCGDGTVVAAGKNDSGQCNTGDWTDIRAVYAGRLSSFGLKEDGTLVSTGYGICGMTYVSSKTPIGVLEFWLDTLDW